MTSIVFKPFAELTLDQLYAALRVRSVVFVVGQQIATEPDPDGKDPACWHVLLSEGEEIVGTCRLLPLEDGQRIKMGRLAVLPKCRGRGHAKAIFNAVHAWLDQRGLPAEMHGQRYLEAFYTTLGWQTVGEPFEEAKIEHVKMIRPARPK